MKLKIFFTYIGYTHLFYLIAENTRFIQLLRTEIFLAFVTTLSNMYLFIIYLDISLWKFTQKCSVFRIINLSLDGHVWICLYFILNFGGVGLLIMIVYSLGKLYMYWASTKSDYFGKLRTHLYSFVYFRSVICVQYCVTVITVRLKRQEYSQRITKTQDNYRSNKKSKNQRNIPVTVTGKQKYIIDNYDGSNVGVMLQYVCICSYILIQNNLVLGVQFKWVIFFE